jgi:excisionase family DNA binding protein
VAQALRLNGRATGSRLVYSNEWHTLGISKRNQTDMLADAKVLTVSELSDYLRVHRSTIYRLLKKGQLPGFKIGSDWRFNVEAIDEWRLHQGAAQLEELRNNN